MLGFGRAVRQGRGATVVSGVERQDTVTEIGLLTSPRMVITVTRRPSGVILFFPSSGHGSLTEDVRCLFEVQPRTRAPPTPPRTDTSPSPRLPSPISLVNQVRASARVGVNGRTPTRTRTRIKVRGSAQELRREEQQRGGRPAGRTAQRPNETGQHAVPLLLPGNNTGTFKL